MRQRVCIVAVTVEGAGRAHQQSGAGAAAIVDIAAVIHHSPL